MLSKLTLGTAQLGLKYGINNISNKPTVSEGIEILNYAYENGITSIDTAADYGDSELVIGSWIECCKPKDIYITSKIPSLSKYNLKKDDVHRTVEDEIRLSMNRMGRDYIDNILVHDFNDIIKYGDVMIEALTRMMEKGYIGEFGCSVYDAESMEFIKDYNFTTVQFPCSIFNQTPLYSPVIDVLRDKGVKLFARSGFVQGLIFIDPDKLAYSLIGLREYIIKLNRLAEEYNIPKSEIAINYLRNHSEIDSIVFGVDNKDQLEDIVNIPYRCSMIYEVVRHVFKDVPQELVDPRSWRLYDYI